MGIHPGFKMPKKILKILRFSQNGNGGGGEGVTPYLPAPPLFRASHTSLVVGCVVQHLRGGGEVRTGEAPLVVPRAGDQAGPGLVAGAVWQVCIGHLRRVLGRGVVMVRGRFAPNAGRRLPK